MGPMERKLVGNQTKTETIRREQDASDVHIKKKHILFCMYNNSFFFCIQNTESRHIDLPNSPLLKSLK